jgi:hypothetical protein
MIDIVEQLEQILSNEISKSIDQQIINKLMNDPIMKRNTKIPKILDKIKSSE